MREVPENAAKGSIVLFGKRIAVFRALAAGICGELIWLATWIYAVKRGHVADGWYAFFHQPVMDVLDGEITAHFKPMVWVFVFALFSASQAVAWIAFWFAVHRACAAVRSIYNEIRWTDLRSRVVFFGLMGTAAGLAFMLIFWLSRQPATGSDDSIFLLVEPPVSGSHGRRLCLVNESKHPVSVQVWSDGEPRMFARRFTGKRWEEPKKGSFMCGNGMSSRIIPPFCRLLVMPLREVDAGGAEKYQVGLDYIVEYGTDWLRTGIAWSDVFD